MNNSDTKIESILKHYRPLGPPTQLKERIFHPKEKKRNRTWLAAAASILVVLSGGLICWIQSGLDNAANRIEKDPTFVELEMEVNQAGIAAGMLAVADLLAQQSGGEEYARNRYLYLAKTYPKKEVAALAKLRLKSLSERSVMQ